MGDWYLLFKPTHVSTKEIGIAETFVRLEVILTLFRSTKTIYEKIDLVFLMNK